MLPYLSEVQNTSKKYSVLFKGLNYGEGAQDGEFAETLNLSTDKYPCISQRAARIEKEHYSNKVSTIHAKGQLLVIDGTKVFYGGKEVGQVTEGKKQVATVGDYVVIFPDKVYYKVPTEDDEGGEFGNMEASFTETGLTFTSSSISTETIFKEKWLVFDTNKISIGKEYKTTGLAFSGNAIAKSGANFPFVSGDVVTIAGCPTASGNNKTDLVVKEVSTGRLTFESANFTSASYGVEVTITRTIKNKFPFKAGDYITISGCSNSGNNKDNEVRIKETDGVTLTFEEDLFTSATEFTEVTFKRKSDKKIPFSKGDNVKITGCSVAENEKEIIVRSVSDNEITFDSNSFTEAIEPGEVTLKREVPELDLICESNYRLWGTRGNTIYSSKFSDPLNFACFEGLSSDSYAIEVATEGEFTGCMPYSSHICFFKENVLHKLYGTKPSNFQITTANIYGVQSGSERSMQIVNEQLLYKGVGGVYSYAGGVPELISEKFGGNRYSEAVACCDGEKYYISMKQDDEWHLFVYDVLKNIWLREDGTHAVDMAFHEGKVHYADSEGGLYFIDKEASRKNIEWGATFCTIHETINQRKGYSKFHLRLDLSAGAFLCVDIKTDNDTKWRNVFTTHGEKAKTVSIPIIPTRCDSIDIKLYGKGECTIRAFIREFTVGSDI